MGPPGAKKKKIPNVSDFGFFNTPRRLRAPLARAHKGSWPNLRNRNSDQAEISRTVQNSENKLVFQILGQSGFFWRFYANFCVSASNKPQRGIIKIIKEIGKNPLNPYPPSTFVGNTLKNHPSKF